jgi:hypothetical protein
MQIKEIQYELAERIRLCLQQNSLAAKVQQKVITNVILLCC